MKALNIDYKRVTFLKSNYTHSQTICNELESPKRFGNFLSTALSPNHVNQGHLKQLKQKALIISHQPLLNSKLNLN